MKKKIIARWAIAFVLFAPVVIGIAINGSILISLLTIFYSLFLYMLGTNTPIGRCFTNVLCKDYNSFWIWLFKEADY